MTDRPLVDLKSEISPTAVDSTDGVEQSEPPLRSTDASEALCLFQSWFPYKSHVWNEAGAIINSDCSAQIYKNKLLLSKRTIPTNSDKSGCRAGC